MYFNFKYIFNLNLEYQMKKITFFLIFTFIVGLNSYAAGPLCSKNPKVDVPIKTIDVGEKEEIEGKIVDVEKIMPKQGNFTDNDLTKTIKIQEYWNPSNINAVKIGDIENSK